MDDKVYRICRMDVKAKGLSEKHAGRMDETTYDGDA